MSSENGLSETIPDTILVTQKENIKNANRTGSKETPNGENKYLFEFIITSQ